MKQNTPFLLRFREGRKGQKGMISSSLCVTLSSNGNQGPITSLGKKKKRQTYKQKNKGFDSFYYHE